MADPSKAKEKLRGWTIVGPKGEIQSEDGDSASSESSKEEVSSQEAASVSEFLGIQDVSTAEHFEASTQEHGAIQTEVAPVASALTVTDNDSLKEADCLGACCQELLELNNLSDPSNNQPETTSSTPNEMFIETKDRNQEQGEAQIADELQSDSDSDSDFVRLDDDNLEDFPVEAIAQANHPNAGNAIDPSIAPEFVFLRQGGASINQRDEPADHDSLGDCDDDTESSTEDGVDDRIESDQSEVGSVLNQNDVGDLSAFGDIGDLPLVAGDVARNYVHKPNNHLSSVLNITLIISAILTTGMSLGIILATDLEIEEWQNAYDIQTRKLSMAEEKLAEATRQIQEFKVQTKNFEAVLQAFAQTDSKDHEAAQNFISKMRKTVNDQSLNQKSLGVTDDVQTSQIKTENQKVISKIEGLVLNEPYQDEIQSNPNAFDVNGQRELFESARRLALESHTLSKDLKSPAVEQETGATTSGNPSTNGEQKLAVGVISPDAQALNSKSLLNVKQLQRSLTREQERAIHWQKLYLAERRQRERDRENEEWEDERDRVRWEEEEMEEDKLDKERWERERDELDRAECIKKLLSTDLQTLTHSMSSWNVSLFDDFANLSLLMSSISELKKSVLASVQDVWESSQNMDKDERGDEMPDGGFLIDKDMVVSYFTKFLQDLKQSVDGDSSSHLNSKETEQEDKESDTGSESNESKRNVFLTGLKKILKKARNSVGKLGKKVQGTWKNVQHFWKGQKETKKMPETSKSMPCGCANMETSNRPFWKNVMATCMPIAQEQWFHKMMKEYCKNHGKYRSECCFKNKQQSKEFIGTLKRELGYLPKWREDTGSPSNLQKDKGNALVRFSVFLNNWSQNGMLKGHDQSVQCCLQCLAHSGLTGATDVCRKNCKDKGGHHNGARENSEEDTATYGEGKGQRSSDYGPVSLVENASDHYADEDERFRLVSPIKQSDETHLSEDMSDTPEMLPSHSQLYQTTDWLLERAQSRLRLRREREKASWVFDQASQRAYLRMSQKYNPATKSRNVGDRVGDWYFDAAWARENHRKKEHESDWLFERARDRRAPAFKQYGGRGRFVGWKVKHSFETKIPNKFGKKFYRNSFKRHGFNKFRNSME